MSGLSGRSVSSGRRLGDPVRTVIASVLLLASLLLAWVEPLVGIPMAAADLPVLLPVGTSAALTWSAVLWVALAAALMSLAPLPRWRPALVRLAAAGAFIATAGLVLQTWLADFPLQQLLSRNTFDLSSLQRLVGYRIPRPNITTAGPIPLPAGAVEIASSLRSGFYLALAGAVLLGWTARTVTRPSPGRGTVDRGVRLVIVGATVIVAITVLQGMAAHWFVDRARSAAAAGDDASAVLNFRTALGMAYGLADQPDVLSTYGLSLVRQGKTGGEPAAQLAISRLRLQAGKDLQALQILSAAAQDWPGQTALTDEFDVQAVSFLQKHGASVAVHTLLPDTDSSAVLRLFLARYELVQGDNPAAESDSREALASAGDDDVRSAALTYLSIAQTRSGDLTGGRETLLAAVEADQDFVNVRARSLLTGLYTTSAP